MKTVNGETSFVLDPSLHKAITLPGNRTVIVCTNPSFALVADFLQAFLTYTALYPGADMYSIGYGELYAYDSTSPDDALACWSCEVPDEPDAYDIKHVWHWTDGKWEKCE